MEPTVRERFTDRMRDDLLARYGVAREHARPLDGFESFIYELNRDDDFILRVSHSGRRNKALILGEVDWINFLADGGAAVTRAIRSEQGRLVEPVDDGAGEHFLATAFVKARGGPPRGTVWHSERFFEAYGQLIGRIHALSKRYRPTNSMAYRPQWDDPLMLEADQHLPPSEEVAARRFEEVVDHLRALPIDDEVYGLIHFDAHGGNMFVDEDGTITLFDFDDCHYHWYINDIAIVIFYAVIDSEDKSAFLDQYLTQFLRGYCRENRLDPRWLDEIPWFLKLREIDLYAIIHRSFDVDNLTDPWVVDFMDGRRQRIEQGAPYLNVDFTAFAGLLDGD